MKTPETAQNESKDRKQGEHMNIPELEHSWLGRVKNQGSEGRAPTARGNDANPKGGMQVTPEHKASPPPLQGRSTETPDLGAIHASTF